MSDEDGLAHHLELTGGLRPVDASPWPYVLTIDGGSSRRLGISRYGFHGLSVNPFVGQVFEHRTSFSRLHHFVLVSDAFVVVPGGFGTVLETMMIWQLLQVRKLYDTLLILAGAMWAELVEWARKSMLRPDGALASPEDFAIPICCRTGPEVLDVLRRHHNQWKSNQEATP